MTDFLDTFPSALKSAELLDQDVDPLYLNHDIKPFKEVLESDDDKVTTESDLTILNNVLAIQHAAAMRSNTVDGIIKLAGSLYKGIELRRKVKKLALGQAPGAGTKTWDID